MRGILLSSERSGEAIARLFRVTLIQAASLFAASTRHTPQARHSNV